MESRTRCMVRSALPLSYLPSQGLPPPCSSTLVTTRPAHELWGAHTQILPPAVSREWRKQKGVQEVCVHVLRHLPVCGRLSADGHLVLFSLRAWEAAATATACGRGNSRDQHCWEMWKTCELSIPHCSFNADALPGDNETRGDRDMCFQFLLSGAAACYAIL